MQQPATSDPAYTTEQAAEILGLKASTLETWRTTKKVRIPHEKVGRAVRYRKSALDRFIAEHTVK